MKEFLENLKILIPIGAAVLAIAGFYYTTEHRLEHLESEIADLQDQQQKLKKMTNRKKSK